MHGSANAHHPAAARGVSAYAFALECVPGGTDAGSAPKVCVQASPNPEYAVNPSNFAHWLLGHVQPLVAAAHAAGFNATALFESRLVIAHGHNRVLPMWMPQYSQLMGPGATCKRSASIVYEHNSSLWHGLGCAHTLEVSVPKFSFCKSQFWLVPSWRVAATELSTRLRTFARIAQTPVELVGRTVVITRGSGQRAGNVLGLEAACNDTRVRCVNTGPGVPLMRVATLLGPGTTAIVAGHGAGLANLLFASPGSRFVEFDHIRSVEYARNFYQQLAKQLGLRPYKVWLDRFGNRYCPQSILGCRRRVSGLSAGPKADAASTSRRSPGGQRSRVQTSLRDHNNATGTCVRAGRPQGCRKPW